MKLKISIDMENAAFEDCNGNEVARILKQLAERLECEALDTDYNMPLGDLNGNCVGNAKVTR